LDLRVMIGDCEKHKTIFNSVLAKFNKIELERRIFSKSYQNCVKPDKG
jgi:hypothetical protein